ncbi:MAG TPA: OB-fold domain-containing protein [Candidatus Binatia bacterium]|nr:OB-fold domain-containing protein [Candidatus Binatia bacterium]
MAETNLQKPLPTITSEARPFWEGAAKQQLLMQCCLDCSAYIWTPRPSCFECGSENIQWQKLSGRGEVYSFTVIRQVVGRAASQAFEKDIPYVIAWIDLDEGPRMITNVIGCPDENVTLGMKVSVVFEQQSADIWLPKFMPVSS